MNLVTAKKLNQVYAYQKDIALIFGYKHPQRLLKAFRDICDERPSYFFPITKPYVRDGDSGASYNIYAFAHYFENRGLLDAGSRSLNFREDLQRLKEVYG